MDPELLDSLSAYEIAVLTFTSPLVAEPGQDEGALVLVTGKDSYVWAGAVAHALVYNPRLNSDEVLGFLRAALEEFAQIQSHLPNLGLRRTTYHESGLPLVEFFLRKAGAPGDIAEIYSRTEDAIRSLQWRGLIEDPFKKRVREVLLSVVLVLPVSFTQSTPDGQTTLEALTWKYSETVVGNRVHREFRVRVREIADAVLRHLVPWYMELATDLAEPSASEVQAKLRELGYYRGPVDGKAGPQTIDALKRFQFDYHLPITGHPDARTTLALKNIKS